MSTYLGKEFSEAELLLFLTLLCLPANLELDADFGTEGLLLSDRFFLYLSVALELYFFTKLITF